MSTAATLEEEISGLLEENEKKDTIIAELREVGERSRFMEEELRRREEQVEQLNKDLVSLEQKVQELTGEERSPSVLTLCRSSSLTHPIVASDTRLSAAEDSCPNCDSFFSSLESERRESSRLEKENKALVNGIFQLQQEVQ